MSERTQALGRPISIDEIEEFIIPPEIFDAFNKMIILRLHAGTAIFYLKEVADMAESMGINRNIAFSNHWFDVEQLYQEAGWIVKFESPGYSEGGEPYFTFSKEQRG